MRVKRWVVVCVVLFAVPVVTGGFTTGTVERPATVTVVDDDAGLLGIEPGSLDRCGTQQLVRLTNRLSTTLTVDATVVDTENVRATIKRTPTALSSGSSAPVDVRLNPPKGGAASGDGAGTIRVRFHARSAVTSVTIVREFDTQCPTKRGQSGR